MKRIVLAVLGCAALGLASLPQQASAADLPARGPALMPVKAPGLLPFNWGGLYAGINLGGGVGGDVTGFILGGQLGYNWQVGRLVFGVETDIQWSDEDKTSILALPAPIGTISATQDLDWFGTFRGRIGYAMWDRWLPYVTGGLAYGGRTIKVPVAAFSAGDTGIGWALGVGVDYAINPLWSARLEYLHISLDSFNVTTPAGVFNSGRLDNDIIRGAVNYKITPY